jgi:ankyrin repeat protein
VENINGMTPLHILSECQFEIKSDVGGVLDYTGLWLEHGVEVNRQFKNNGTPMLLEIGMGMYKHAWNCIELKADAYVENKTGETSVHQVSQGQDCPWECSVGTQLLLKCGMDINAQDENHNLKTPSHLQSNFGLVQMAQALLNHGANVNAGNNRGGTLLCQELEGEYHI